MNHQLIHVSLDKKAESFPWSAQLDRHDLSLAFCNRVEAVGHYLRAYPILMILIDVPAVDASLLAAIAAIRGLTTVGPRPPLVVLARQTLQADALRQLAEAGCQDLIQAADPFEFLRWRLDLLRALRELDQFQEERMNVAVLARKTRETLHDMTQPLSAVQGRLQLMASKCPAGDPNAKHFHDMVRLMFDVTGKLMAIHQLHREHS